MFTTVKEDAALDRNKWDIKLCRMGHVGVSRNVRKLDKLVALVDREVKGLL